MKKIALHSLLCFLFLVFAGAGHARTGAPQAADRQSVKKESAETPFACKSSKDLEIPGILQRSVELNSIPAGQEQYKPRQSGQAYFRQLVFSSRLRSFFSRHRLLAIQTVPVPQLFLLNCAFLN